MERFDTIIRLQGRLGVKIGGAPSGVYVDRIDWDVASVVNGSLQVPFDVFVHFSQPSSPPRSPGRRSCDRRRPAESRVPRLLGGSSTSPECRTHRHPSRLPAAVIQNKEASFELKRQTYAHILVIELCGIGIKLKQADVQCSQT